MRRNIGELALCHLRGDGEFFFVRALGPDLLQSANHALDGIAKRIPQGQTILQTLLLDGEQTVLNFLLARQSFLVGLLLGGFARGFGFVPVFLDFPLALVRFFGDFEIARICLAIADAIFGDERTQTRLSRLSSASFKSSTALVCSVKARV